MKVTEEETHCCLYLGFELCPHWMQHAADGAVNALVAPVLNYFIATELQYAKPQSSAMGVQAKYLPWAGLSFPNPANETETPMDQADKHETKLTELHWSARNDVLSLQQMQWLHEQHQYEQQQTAALQQQRHHQQQQNPCFDRRENTKTKQTNRKGQYRNGQRHRNDQQKRSHNVQQHHNKYRRKGAAPKY